MNEMLIKNWNDTVYNNNCVVVIVGDLAMGGKSKAEKLISYLERMNGKKYLVPGNHDTYVMDKEFERYIKIMPPESVIRVKDPDAPKGRQKIIVSHYSHRVWEDSHHSSWMLYGHSHGSLPIDWSIKSFDVGVDGTGDGRPGLYRPYSYHEIKKMMERHGQEQVDHHDSDTNDFHSY
jgi:calcineurin-like phosphoesterase family protein